MTQHPSSKPPLVVPSTSRKELIIGIAVAVVIFAAILYGMSSMGNKISANKLTGVIEGKEFSAAQETQVTFGSGGVKSEEIKGSFFLKVRARGDLYWVGVDEATYNSRKEGESYTFAAPQPEPKSDEKK